MMMQTFLDLLVVTVGLGIANLVYKMSPRTFLAVRECFMIMTSGTPERNTETLKEPPRRGKLALPIQTSVRVAK